MGAFDSNKSTEFFFAAQVARTALEVTFRTSFGDRNRNCENTPDMSFGSNGVDCERSIRKNQMALGVGFRTSFGDRNRNCENPPDMSFGSNGVDWERSIRKNQL